MKLDSVYKRLERCSPEVNGKASLSSYKSTTKVLFHEVVDRGILLTYRTGKTFFATAHLITSPLLIAAKQDTSFGKAWDHFSKEARHLVAELFEYVTAVVFSILHLPFDRTQSSLLLKAQAWIEKKAEIISGQSQALQEAATKITGFRSEKQLYLDIRNQVTLSEEKSSQWEVEVNKCDELFRDYDFSKKRDISREFFKEMGSRWEEDIKSTLQILKGLVENKIPEAIEKQKQTLSNLKRNQEPEDEKKQDEADLINQQLEIFKQQRDEINELTVKQRKIDDPKGDWASKLENLDNRIRFKMASEIAREKQKHNKGLKEATASAKKRLKSVFEAQEKIKKAYSYEDLLNSSSKEKFDENLEKLFSKCEECFYKLPDEEEKKSDEEEEKSEFPGSGAWNSQYFENFFQGFNKSFKGSFNYPNDFRGNSHYSDEARPANVIHMDVSIAKSVLGVDQNAGRAAIKKAYRRLANLHHPDKAKQNGLGQAQEKEYEKKFIEIQQAYELLTKEQ